MAIVSNEADRRITAAAGGLYDENDGTPDIVFDVLLPAQPTKEHKTTDGIRSFVMKKQPFSNLDV